MYRDDLERVTHIAAVREIKKKFPIVQFLFRNRQCNFCQSANVVLYSGVKATYLDEKEHIKEVEGYCVECNTCGNLAFPGGVNLAYYDNPGVNYHSAVEIGHVGKTLALLKHITKEEAGNTDNTIEVKGFRQPKEEITVIKQREYKSTAILE